MILSTTTNILTQILFNVVFYFPAVCNLCVIVKTHITFYLQLHELLIGAQGCALIYSSIIKMAWSWTQL
jgi:hypothetical protein